MVMVLPEPGSGDGLPCWNSCPEAGIEIRTKPTRQVVPHPKPVVEDEFV